MLRQAHGLRKTRFISPEEALGIVLAAVRPLASRRAALGEAAHSYLAEDIRCDRDQPPADRAAMDGYAVRAADLRRPPARLRLVGEVAAGSAGRSGVRPGTCAAILTGGNVPPGADAVVPVEQTGRQGPDVVFASPARRGMNIRRRGEEARRGQVLLRTGARLGPAEAGVCALVGRARVRVRRQPRLAVLCTGAEVRDASERVSPHETRDSNGPALLNALAEQGLPDVERILAPDDPRAIARHLRRALRGRDLVFVTGGVSVGRYDFVPEAVRAAGGRIRFHGVRMKPGQPVLYASVRGNRHILALPGNPVSALAGFFELGLPAIRRLRGEARRRCRPSTRMRLGRPARSKGSRTYFALARVVQTDDGPRAFPVASKGSADIAAASRADGTIVVPEGVTELPAGAWVDFHSWKKT